MDDARPHTDVMAADRRHQDFKGILYYDEGTNSIRKFCKGNL